MDDKKLTNCLKKVRMESHITQEQLAESVGVSRQTIIAIEKGNYTPSVSLSLRIAMVFNLKVEEIFAYE